jgi:hypothetical protein
VGERRNDEKAADDKNRYGNRVDRRSVALRRGVARRSSVPFMHRSLGAYVPEQEQGNAIRHIARPPGFRAEIEIRVDRV